MSSPTDFLRWAMVFGVALGGGGGGGTYLPLAGGTMTGDLILNGAPTTSLQAANKGYVDAAVAGLAPANPVDAATTAALVGTYNNGASGVGATFTMTATGVQTLGGVTVTVGRDYLFKDQTDGTQNGRYTCTTAGSIGVASVFTRTVGYDTPTEINNTGIIPVALGTLAGTGWLQTNTIVTIGTTPLVYLQFGSTGTVTSITAGAGLTGGTITTTGTIALDIPVAVVSGGTGATTAGGARTNLGLGSMATQAASSVAITGGSAVFADLRYIYNYTDLVGNIAITATDTNEAFVMTIAGIDVSDGLGLASFTKGFQFVLKNVSGGDCTFTPFAGDLIDGLASYTIGSQQAVVIMAGTSQWSVIAQANYGGGGGGYVPLPTSVVAVNTALLVNRAYVANDPAQITFSLPATAAVGDIIDVSGIGAGGWLISQNASQSIIFNSLTTTVGIAGSLAVTSAGHSVTLRCVVANTTFLVIAASGNITVV